MLRLIFILLFSTSVQATDPTFTVNGQIIDSVMFSDTAYVYFWDSSTNQVDSTLSLSLEIIEFNDPNKFPKIYLEDRKKIHKKGISKRFPSFPKDIIESTWSGVVCRSRNGSQIFEKINDKVFVAGCYNGSGIGTGTFFGEQIALMASNQDSEKIAVIQNRVKPTRLPSDILLNIGVYTRLFYERLRARTEF